MTYNMEINFIIMIHKIGIFDVLYLYVNKHKHTSILLPSALHNTVTIVLCKHIMDFCCVEKQ